MKEVSANFIIWYFRHEQVFRLGVNIIISLIISFLINILCIFLNFCLTQLMAFISSIISIELPHFSFVSSTISIALIIVYLFHRFMHFAHEYCLNYRPEKTFLEEMGKIKNNINNDTIYEIFKNFISRHASSISNNQLQNLDQLNLNYVDLAAALELTSINSDDKLVFSGNDTFINGKALSSVRRERVLHICKSLLNNHISKFYATEFHLIDVISDEAKWNDDKDYREALQEDANIKNCSNKTRIIGIKKSDYDRIKNHPNYKGFISYLKWHIDNNWEAHLYIIDDHLFPIQLTKLGKNIKCCNDLTDFLYVEFCSKKSLFNRLNATRKALFTMNKEKIKKAWALKTTECVVFAQNDEGLCKFFKKPSQQTYNPVSDYKSLFESLLDSNEDNEIKRQQHILLKQEFITSLENNKVI